MLSGEITRNQSGLFARSTWTHLNATPFWAITIVARRKQGQRLKEARVTPPFALAGATASEASAMVMARRDRGRAEGADHPSLACYDVLLELQRAPGGRLRPHEIGRRLLLAQPNVSRLIDRLEHAGPVTQNPCPEDGRGRHVAITPAGRAFRRRMWPAYRAAVERHLGARLESVRAAETLAALLARLAEPP